MYILRSMFVISGSSLYPGFIIERFNCIVGELVLYNVTCGIRGGSSMDA